MGPPQDEGDRVALERLLGVAEMAWLVDRVRARTLSAGDEPLRGVVELRAPTAEQRAAVVRLVGRPRRPGATVRVDLSVVEEVLRRGPWPAGLADAVRTLTGPVVDRRAQRQQESAAWEAARSGLGTVVARFPHLAGWWSDWCTDGGLKRAARAEADRISASPSPRVGDDLVSRVAAVFELLPAADVPLAVLARQAVGDAHGLDASRPLGRLAVTVVREAFVPDTATADGDLSPREIWAAAGVVLSGLASTVLCLGVPGVSTTGAGSAGLSRRTATATTLEAMRAARTPVVLTLDQVRSGGIRALPNGSAVHVCENPAVVEVVAQRWARTRTGNATSGAVGPVLVCTSGQPSTAVVDLLRRLAAEGAQCRYHGDFDWAGLRIAQSLAVQMPWAPWRFSAADYRAAVQDGRPSRRLTGRRAPSPWDPDLAAAMDERGLAVEEEAVADLLARDLLTVAPRPSTR